MIVDFHTHIFPPGLIEQRERYIQRDATFAELFADPKAKMATAEDLVEAMDEDRVDRSVAMGIGWTDHSVAREVNDYIIESVRHYPERIVGFAGISPAWGELAVHEADRCANEGLRGIGELHADSQRYDIGDEKTMAPLMELARQRGLIVTTHASEPVGHAYPGKGETRPEKLWRFVRSFPDNAIVCAHWGGGLPFYALMPEVAESLANVYFDSAASPFLYRPEVFSAVKGLVGVERILMGSDYPLLRASRLVAQAEESGLVGDDLAAILGGNAERLLEKG